MQPGKVFDRKKKEGVFGFQWSLSKETDSVFTKKKKGLQKTVRKDPSMKRKGETNSSGKKRQHIRHRQIMLRQKGEA